MVAVVLAATFCFWSLPVDAPFGLSQAHGAAPPPPPPPTPPGPGAPAPGAPGAPGVRPAPQPAPAGTGQNPTAILLAPQVGVICPQQPLPPGVEVSPRPDAVTVNRRPPISVKFPEAVDPKAVVVQVDSQDVTSALVQQEARFTYEPQADLRPGIHRVSVQGGPAPIEWCFAQRKFAEIDDLSAAGEFSVTEEYALKKPTQDDPRNKLSGNAHVVGRAADGDVTATTEWNVRYLGTWNPEQYRIEPNPGPHGTVDGVDVPNFRTVLSYKQNSAELGDINIQESTLVAPSFPRRGVQVKIGVPFWNAEGHFFGARPQVDTTSRHLTGLDNENERLFGGSVAFSPFVTDPSLFRLKSTYVAGVSQNQGAASIATTSAEQNGSALSFLVTSAAFQNRARFEGEYATSWFDPAVTAATGRNLDKAGRARLELQDASLQVVEKPVQLRLNGEYDYVGAFYQSIANTGLQQDRQKFFGDGGVGWGPINVTLNGERSHDNVANNSSRARIYSTLRGVGFTLAQPDWPSLNLNVSRTNQESVRDPFDFTNNAPFPRVDNVVNQLGGTLAYTWRFLSLNLGAQKSQTLDYTRLARNTNVLAYNAGLSLNLFEGRFVLSPTVTWTETETLPTDDLDQLGMNKIPTPVSSVLTRTAVATVTATGIIIPGELTFDGQFSLTDTRVKPVDNGVAPPIGTLTFSNQTVNKNAVGRLTWNFEKYIGNYGRQALSLRVNWNNVADRLTPANDRSDVGFYLILDVFAPFLF